MDRACVTDGGSRHYQDAYSSLVIMFGSTAILPPRTKRWAEAKVLADCINLKVWAPSCAHRDLINCAAPDMQALLVQQRARACTSTPQQSHAQICRLLARMGHWRGDVRILELARATVRLFLVLLSIS